MTAGSASSTLATWRGRRILGLLCAVAFLHFTGASITNVALPHIRVALGFSAQDLQWVPSAYLLTFGGFMLLGGRLADLVGRRSVILAGTSLVAVATSQTTHSLARPRRGAGGHQRLPACAADRMLARRRRRRRPRAMDRQQPRRSHDGGARRARRPGPFTRHSPLVN
jgi:Major Facilitator Superfamily